MQRIYKKQLTTSGNTRPLSLYGGYAFQKPSGPRKSGRPESTPIPAPAVMSMAFAF